MTTNQHLDLFDLQTTWLETQIRIGTKEKWPPDDPRWRELHARSVQMRMDMDRIWHDSQNSDSNCL